MIKKSNYVIGLYGAGPQRTEGNRWLKDLVCAFGENCQTSSHLYPQYRTNTALRELLFSLDVNKSGTITGKEIDGLSLAIIGYSWGGIAAARLCHQLSRPCTIVITDPPRRPRTIRLKVPIPFTLLFTIDPVRHLKFPKIIPETVANFVNYYQSNGGDSVFRPHGDAGEQKIGNWLSRRLKGCPLDSKAQKSTQVDVAKTRMKMLGQAFAMSDDFREYCLEARETGHDGIPWLVSQHLPKR